MKKTIALAVLSIATLAGCGNLGTRPAPETRTVEKFTFVDVPPNTLAKCKEPVKVEDAIPGLASKKVTEKELLQAYINSHTNEVECYGLKLEVIRLQKEVEGKNK
jgi:hypothetical protein